VSDIASEQSDVGPPFCDYTSYVFKMLFPAQNDLRHRLCHINHNVSSLLFQLVNVSGKITPLDPFCFVVWTVSSENLNFTFLTYVLMFELFMYVYSCNALSARFFAVDRALNSYFMIMIMSDLGQT